MAKDVVSRPFGITLIMIYGFFVGLANIAGGIFVILDRNNIDLIRESFHTPNQLVAAGVVAIAVGTAQVFLASALGHANNVVRVLYGVIASLNLAVGLWATLALHSEQRAAGIMAALFSGLILFLLFNHKADEYFEAK
jgi:hypothetical protein